MVEQDPEIQRWTAKRKAAVVLEVLKGKATGVEACRKYGIKQSELGMSRGVYFYELDRRIVLRVCNSQPGSVAAAYFQDPSVFGL